MNNEALEYVKQDNIEEIVQRFGEEQKLHIWLSEKEEYDNTEIEVIAEISNHLWINHFEETPEEWIDFVHEDIKESELQSKAEELQETLITRYVENEIYCMEGELDEYIYSDYCKWFESEYEKDSTYDNLRVSVRILVDYDTAFVAEDLIDARRVIRDNM